MVRNSTLYRRLWYVKKRNTGILHIFMSFISIAIILGLFIFYAQKILLPSFTETARLNTELIVEDIINRTVAGAFPKDRLYEDFVIISRDRSNRIVSIQTDVAKLSRLSEEVAAGVREKLSLEGKEKIFIPLGNLLGKSIFYGIGPELKLDVRLCGDVETDFRSEFSNIDINQTKHNIFLQIRTKVKIVAPLAGEEFEQVTDIPVTEAVIVGNIPRLYSTKK